MARIGEKVVFHKRYKDLTTSTRNEDIGIGVLINERKGERDLSHHGSPWYAIVSTIRSDDGEIYENYDSCTKDWYRTVENYMGMLKGARDYAFEVYKEKLKFIELS